MKKSKYFIVKTPTTIATYKLGVPQHIREKWAKEAYKYDANNYKTNVKGQMSSYTVYGETNTYNKLLDKITETVQTNNTEIRPIEEGMKYQIFNAWTAIYRENDYARAHHHCTAMLSFVYYIKVGAKTSPLKFTQCQFQIEPEDDLLIVFDSALVHEVPPHKGEDRIVLAGNITLPIIARDEITN